MQFETLNPNFLKQSLQADSRLCCKLDWLTIIFKDCSMMDVLRWVGLENELPEFLTSITLQTRGLDQKYVLRFNGVSLEASSLIFYGLDLDSSIFDLTIPSIRLDLSGTGLDYLRSVGINVNQLRYKSITSSCEGASRHVTRCDFAFDFINYAAGFVDELIHFIQNNRLPSDRVPLAGSNSAVSASIRTGGEKTVYLGSPQSDKLLRVYDKRMQYVDLATGIYKRKNPYNNPKSWFRIEWQTRNKFADGLVTDLNADFIHVLRLIFDRYAFAKADHDNVHNGTRPPVDFWRDLINWQDVVSITVHNGDLVYFKSPEERLDESVVRYSFPVLMYISRYGLTAYLNKISAVVNSLDLSNPSDCRRLDIYRSKLCEFNIPVNIDNQNLKIGFNQIEGKLLFVLEV